MANAPKPTTAKKESSSGSNIFASLSIVMCIFVGVLLWKFVMGDPSNFEGGDPENGHPLPGNYF
jgi:biopolymer transport protein ExbB